MSFRIIIAGGGTGGHIFPAISIAGEVLRRRPDAEVLFVGAEGGMEMEVVPRHGYEIRPVWISGINRQLTARNILRNLLFPVKLMTSLVQANRIHRDFRPDVVVGVGGYASGPMGRVAALHGTPLVLCEQNAYPGLVNRWLAPKAERILLGNEAAQRYFDANKTRITGNPIRDFAEIDRETARRKLGLDPDRPVLLSLGGSLGAQSINEALARQLPRLKDSAVQLLWQCGKRYVDRMRPLAEAYPNVTVKAFIDDMAAAYAAADLVITRAGGSTISELIALQKPAVFVPSPNVAEDHQTKNARSLTERGAGALIPDAEARERLLTEALDLLRDENRLASLRRGIAAVEHHDAAREIVDTIFELHLQPASP